MQTASCYLSSLNNFFGLIIVWISDNSYLVTGFIVNHQQNPYLLIHFLDSSLLPFWFELGVLNFFVQWDTLEFGEDRFHQSNVFKWIK